MTRRYSDYERGRLGRSYAEEEERSYEPGARSSDDLESRRQLEQTSGEVHLWRGDERSERRRDEGDYRQPLFSISNLRAKKVMTRDPVVVLPDETVQRAAWLMQECDCGILPVVDSEGHLMGMITDRDITMRLVARGVDTRRARVTDCMTSEAFSCHENESVESCMRKMSRFQIRRIPIVDHHNRVIGIVSQSDLAMHAGHHPGNGERRAMADVLCAVSGSKHPVHH